MSEGLIWFLLIGLAAGWLAGQIMKKRSTKKPCSSNEHGFQSLANKIASFIVPPLPPANP